MNDQPATLLDAMLLASEERGRYAPKDPKGPKAPKAPPRRRTRSDG